MPDSPFSLSSPPTAALAETRPQAAESQAVAQRQHESARARADGDDDENGPADDDGADSGIDLRWVWLEVRKRVFIKLPFSRPIAEAMEVVVPIALEDNIFICGLSTQNFPMSGHLAGDNVRNTIKGILRQAAGHDIQFEVIEGTTLADWREIKSRRSRAQEAVIAMAEQKVGLHHYEDVLNQIVGEIRGRVTGTRDRLFPQVRAALVFDVVPLLADAADMLFADRDAHDARRAMARSIDRVAAFLEIQPLALAMEVERYHRAQAPRPQHQETSSAFATSKTAPAASQVASAKNDAHKANA